MHPPNHKPTETYIGNTDVREDLLRQEASKRHALSALSAMLALVLVILGVLAAVVVGLGEAISWIVTYLIPTLVILGVVVGTIFLVTWEGGKAYDTRYRINSQTSEDSA
jgi:uncharacterized Tic20 family protein